MMESIALTESHVVEEEDYVLVSVGSIDNDDDSYDYCDDDSIASTCDASTSSYSISISDNFKNSTPHLGSLAEEATDVSVVSTEDSDNRSRENGSSSVVIEGDCINPVTDILSEEKKPDRTCEETKDDSNQIQDDNPPDNGTTEIKKDNPSGKSTKKKELETEDEPQTPRVGGSRLSNKKRRKKMKLMKKAAAAATAAAALAEIQKHSSPPIKPEPVLARQGNKGRTKSKKKGQRSSNLAVSCATESIAQYRDEHNLKTLPAQNYMSLL